MRKSLAASVFLGSLFLAPVAAAQIVINEVLYNPLGTSENGLERVELKNFGPSPVNVGGYRLCAQFDYGPAFPANTMIPAGGFYVIHVNQSGTNTATDFFTGPWLTGTLGNTSDSFAVYLPGVGFADPDLMVSFVSWGAPNTPRETEAVAAGLWVNDTFAPAVADGHSIEYLGSGVGGSRWVDQPNPTIGSENGSVPVDSKTWGKIKALYY